MSNLRYALYSEMGKRKYELKARAEQVEQTRRRITEAAIELHRTVGPAGTRISEVARRAGVQRRTVYNHFPDEGSLLAACSAHWRALHPAPDPARWLTIADPSERLRCGLRDLYGWYRETEPMTGNVLRDAQLLPALREIIEGGLGAYVETVQGVLTESLRAHGGRGRERVAAACRAVTGFQFWQALSPLGDDAAADLGASLVEVAAQP